MGTADDGSVRGMRMRCEIGNLSLLLARIVAWYTYSAVKQAVAHGTSLRISSSLLRRYREIVRVSWPPES